MIGIWSLIATIFKNYKIQVKKRLQFFFPWICIAVELKLFKKSILNQSILVVVQSKKMLKKLPWLIKIKISKNTIIFQRQVECDLYLHLPTFKVRFAVQVISSRGKTLLDQLGIVDKHRLKIQGGDVF